MYQPDWGIGVESNKKTFKEIQARDEGNTDNIFCNYLHCVACPDPF